MQKKIPEHVKALKSEIIDQYGSVYAYAKKFDESESELSRMLTGRRPPTLKLLEKHCKNLGMTMQIQLKSRQLQLEETAEFLETGWTAGEQKSTEEVPKVI